MQPYMSFGHRVSLRLSLFLKKVNPQKIRQDKKPISACDASVYAGKKCEIIIVKHRRASLFQQAKLSTKQKNIIFLTLKIWQTNQLIMTRVFVRRL